MCCEPWVCDARKGVTKRGRHTVRGVGGAWDTRLACGPGAQAVRAAWREVRAAEL